MPEIWLLEDGTPWLNEDGSYLYLETADEDTGPPPVVIPETPGLPPLPSWSLDLCRNWVRIAEVDAFTFTGIERFNEPGEWSLEVSPGSISEWSISGILDANGVMGVFGPADVDSVILWRDDEVAFPGLVAPVSEGFGSFDSERDGSSHVLRWSGPDLWGVLGEAIAFPDPTIDATNADPTPWTVTHDVRAGIASAALAGFIRDNLSEIAPIIDRRYPGLEVDDRTAGSAGPWSSRLAYLDDLASRIASDGGCRCRLELQGDLTIRVIIDAPSDLSAAVVISDQTDLSNVKMRRIPRSADWVLAAGEGQGVDRQFQVASSAPPSGRRRIERFDDQSSLSELSELLRSAETRLRLGAASWSIDAEVTDNLARVMRYGRDFRVGDLLTVEVDGVRYSVPVVAAAYEINPERQHVRPQLGTGTPDELRGLLRDIANLAARLDRQIA